MSFATGKCSPAAHVSHAAVNADDLINLYIAANNTNLPDLFGAPENTAVLRKKT
jgi:hypothetical protein